ncbi:MAG: hypothetical protein JXR64_14070 [Spirochaetales bacterium]|nr:hypothetical protein [Spirochaetales bacterium]
MIDKKYKYFKELRYLINCLDKIIGRENVEIYNVSCIVKHMSQPAEVKMLYKKKKYNVDISIDSGYLSAIIRNGNGSLPISRYQANSGEYNNENFNLSDYEENTITIENFIIVLKEILENDHIYFYVWEDNKRYKIINGVKKKLKPNEF